MAEEEEEKTEILAEIAHSMRAHLQQEASNLSKLYEHKKSYKIDDFGYIIIRSDMLNGVS